MKNQRLFKPNVVKVGKFALEIVKATIIASNLNKYRTNMTKSLTVATQTVLVVHLIIFIHVYMVG